jgi:WhiB family transcriptional regulator, redox-sensing transcriptional regulator
MYEPWLARAACAGVDPNFFFPDSDADETEAARWCVKRCPVVEQCRVDALALDTLAGDCYGAVGGMTAAERRVIVRSRRSIRGDVIEDYLAAYPLLSVRKLVRLIRAEGGPPVSYRTLARRRSPRHVA